MTHSLGQLRWWQGTALAAGLAFALLATGAVVASRHLEGILLRTLSARMHRELRIDGEFDAHLLSRDPTIRATDVSVRNPPWMPKGTLAHFGRVAVTVKWRLSSPFFELRRLELVDAKVHLLRDTTGHANWYAQDAGPGNGPPLIYSLSMPEARVELHDDLRHLEFEGSVSATEPTSDPGRAPPLRIRGRGSLNGRPASFVIEGDALAEVRPNHPYHFRLEEHSGATRLNADGSLRTPFDFRSLEGIFQASGPDLSDLYYLVGLRWIQTGEFRASGRLIRNHWRFLYKDLVITSGKSDVAGTLTVDGSGPGSRPQVEGELTSDLLRSADFGTRPAGNTEAKAPVANSSDEKPTLRLPDAPLRLVGIQRTDTKVRFHARELALKRLTLYEVSTAISTDHGVLSIKDFRGSLAQGQLSGSARFDASRDPPEADLELSANELHLEQLHPSGGAEFPVSGTLSARTELSARGYSPHQLASTLNGKLTVVIPHGTMRAAIAEAVGLDLSGVLGLMRKSQEQTDIRCGVASVEAHDGVATLRTLVVDADKVLITGRGDLQLETEALNITLHGRPKRPMLALHEGLAIRGTLAHPEMQLTGKGAVAQAGAAVALGALLTPVAAVLAFVNPGLARDADCAALTTQAGGD